MTDNTKPDCAYQLNLRHKNGIVFVLRCRGQDENTEMVRKFNSISTLVREVRYRLPERWRPSFCHGIIVGDRSLDFRKLVHGLVDFCITFGESKEANPFTKRADFSGSQSPFMFSLTAQEGDVIICLVVRQVVPNKHQKWFEVTMTCSREEPGRHDLEWEAAARRHDWLDDLAPKVDPTLRNT